MLVTLIDPLWNYDVHCMSEPLGILYVAQALRNAGHEVRFIPTAFVDLESELDRKSELIGFTSTTALFDNAKALLQRTRALCPEAALVVGGSHATVATQDALAAGFHAVFVGEGEVSMVKFAENLEKGDPFATPGIAWLDEHGVMRKNPPPPVVENLDEIVFPARDLFPYREYFARGGHDVGMVSGRGCPWQCIFCQPTIDKLHGRYRKRGAPNVAREMAGLLDMMTPPMLYFKDDTMAANGAKWFYELKAEFDALGIAPRWKCNNRVDVCSDELAEAMAEAGCREMIFGVDSGSQRILDYYNKRARVEDAEAAFATCRKHGIATGANILLGAPIETREELEKTLELVLRLRPDNYWVFLLTALPGKHLTDRVQSEGLLRTRPGYHFYDTAMNGVRGESNIIWQHVTEDDLRSVRDRIFQALPNRQGEIARVYARTGAAPMPDEVEKQSRVPHPPV